MVLPSHDANVFAEMTQIIKPRAKVVTVQMLHYKRKIPENGNVNCVNTGYNCDKDFGKNWPVCGVILHYILRIKVYVKLPIYLCS